MECWWLTRNDRECVNGFENCQAVKLFIDRRRRPTRHPHGSDIRRNVCPFALVERKMSADWLIFKYGRSRKALLRETETTATSRVVRCLSSRSKIAYTSLALPDSYENWSQYSLTREFYDSVTMTAKRFYTQTMQTFVTFLPAVPIHTNVLYAIVLYCHIKIGIHTSSQKLYAFVRK